MSTRQMAALALAAVLVFWVLGAYNRLMAQRNGIADAWARLQDALRQRAGAVEPLVAALRGPMAGESGALDALLQAHALAVRAAADMSARPVREAHAQAWVGAEAALSAAASRVLALLDQEHELRAQAPVTALLAAWGEAQARLPFLRQLFNEVASDYNDAAAQFPTSLVARLFSFGRCGRL